MLVQTERANDFYVFALPTPRAVRRKQNFVHAVSLQYFLKVLFLYKCDNYYAPQYEGAIAWNDPELAIDWGVPEDKVILSERDTNHPTLKESGFLFNYSVDYFI